MTGIRSWGLRLSVGEVLRAQYLEYARGVGDAADDNLGRGLPLGERDRADLDRGVPGGDLAGGEAGGRVDTVRGLRDRGIAKCCSNIGLERLVVLVDVVDRRDDQVVDVAGCDGEPALDVVRRRGFPVGRGPVLGRRA
jgi:hypothetical protein